MVAVDTCTVVAYLRGDSGEDVDAFDAALESGHVVLPPVVVTECLSAPRLERGLAKLVRSIPTLETTEDYWARAGAMRAAILAQGLRARLADTLVAQSCIDHRVALITRDADFGQFARLAGLRLAV